MVQLLLKLYAAIYMPVFTGGDVVTNARDVTLADDKCTSNGSGVKEKMLDEETKDETILDQLLNERGTKELAAKL